MNPLVSLCIITRNRVNVLTNCLESCLQQSYKNFEIVLLDDNSDVPLVQEPKWTEWKEKFEVRLFRSEYQRGVAGSRNFVACEANGEILVFIDDDAVFTNEQALELIVEEFTQCAELGALAFHIVNRFPDGTTQYFLPFQQAAISRDATLTRTPRNVSYFGGAGHALKRSAFVLCEGYDERLFWGEEELELSYKLIEEGFVLKFQPKVSVDHFPKPSLLSKEKPEIFHHVQNRFILAKKFIPWISFPFYLCIWNLVYFRRALKSSSLRHFFRGFVCGLEKLYDVERVGLSSSTREYLRKNYGRLWY